MTTLMHIIFLVIFLSTSIITIHAATIDDQNSLRGTTVPVFVSKHKEPNNHLRKKSRQQRRTSTREKFPNDFVKRKIFSKRRYFAQYSGKIGRESVRRCASRIIEDDDNTDYTVFEADFEIKDGLDITENSSLENKPIDCILSLRNIDDIIDVEEDHLVTILDETTSSPRIIANSLSDTNMGAKTSWGIKAIQADQLEPGPHQVTVCVVDTGIAINHPGVEPNRIRGQDSYALLHRTSSNDRVMRWNHDSNGHGTHTAGIILDVVDSGSIRKRNSENDTEYNSAIDLFVVKAFDDNDFGYESDIIRAVRICVDVGKANIINLSLGNAYAPSKFMSKLYSSIVENDDVMLVAAAGNDENHTSTTAYYPAFHPSVVSVGAMKKNGMLFPNSVRNEQVEIVAPGAEIVSTSVKWNKDGTVGGGSIENIYEYRSGTSCAAPHITGGLALLKSHFPLCSTHQLRYAMAKSAVRHFIEDAEGNRDGLLMLSTLRSEHSVVTSDSLKCDSTRGYGNFQVRDTFDWLLAQGGCDSFHVKSKSRGGCTTLEEGIVDIRKQNSSTNKHSTKLLDTEEHTIRESFVQSLIDDLSLFGGK